MQPYVAHRSLRHVVADTSHTQLDALSSAARFARPSASLEFLFHRHTNTQYTSDKAAVARLSLLDCAPDRIVTTKALLH